MLASRIWKARSVSARAQGKWVRHRKHLFSSGESTAAEWHSDREVAIRVAPWPLLVTLIMMVSADLWKWKLN